MASGYTFIVADDHPLFRGALRQAVTSGDAAAAIIEAGTFDEAKDAMHRAPDADLVLLDLAMPGVSGLSGLIALKAMNPTIPVVIVSARDDPATIRRAIELGASGFISKASGMEQIRRAIADVLAGQIVTPAGIDLGRESDPEIDDILRRIRSLTPQQARVLNMMAEGLLNKQIAYELNVSEATVKAHVSAVLQKLDVDSRTQAVIQLGRIAAEVVPEAS